MITPTYSITASERPLPSMMLDFMTASLDARVSFSRALDTATTVNSSGYIQSVSANNPRFWYDPITKVSKGLLIEASRQNLLSYSDAFDNLVWNLADAAITPNTTASPDNTQNADTAASSGVGFVGRAVGITADTSTYCCSIFVKYLSGTEGFRLRIALTGGIAVATFISINAKTGAFTESSAGATYTIEPYANGFWRISLLATNNNTNTNLNYQLFTTNDAPATNSMAIYGAQAEVGAFPSSYIPTTTTSLTRNDDVAAMTGANFSSWVNTAQGTLNAEVIPTNVTNQSVAFLSDGTNNNRMGITTVAGVFPSYKFQSSSGDFNGSGTTPYVTGNLIKGAITYKSNLQTAAFNGVLVTGISSLAVVPTLNTLKIGSDAAGAELMTGFLQKIRFYPLQLTDAEIAALTK